MPNHVSATFRAYPDAERWEFTQDEIISILTALVATIGGDVEQSDRFGPFSFGPGGNVIVDGRDIPIWTLWRKYQPQPGDVRTWATAIAAVDKL